MGQEWINLIGAEVSHEKGGSGRIIEDLGVGAFSGLHLFRVRWDAGARREETAAVELIYKGARLSVVLSSIRRRLNEEAKKHREQEEIRTRIEHLLELGQFKKADRAYLSCTKFWPHDSYLREREARRHVHRKRILERWATRRQTRQKRIRGKIIHLLQNLQIEEADDMYVKCRSWWTGTEFEELRYKAICTKNFVDAYASASLASMDIHYRNTFCRYLNADDFARVKLPKLRLRTARLGMSLDEEQLLACARPEKHRLIRARAGSGKTRTLAALAALTIQDEGLNPDQVLILAFNKKASNEIGERVRGAAGIDEFRNARTFHSLAWQLADHAGRTLIFDDGNLAPSRRKQTGFVERLIPSIMNPAFRERLYEFFRHELEQLDRLGSNLSREEYVAFRRSLVDHTLGGETVKSNGEKFIADFLFEHGIEYRYEKVWSWDKLDRMRGTAYRPDFSINDRGQDIILEHWAVDPKDDNAQVPDWWESSTKDYLDQIEAKRKFWAMRGVTLLETNANMLSSGREAFEKSLKALLEGAGVSCRKLPYEELVRRVAEAPRTVSRMAELFLQFISRAKKRGYSVNDIGQIVRETPDPEQRNRAFHELAIHAYAAYERLLIEQSAIDFDDLLISAANCVQKDGGAARLQLDRIDSIAIRDLRWILVDEFQDFSELYHRLIHAIVSANPLIRIVSVGDDWQAINGFAGAQLTFFNRFEEHFANAGSSIISRNRRSGRVIVGAGNQLMQGQGVPAIADHHFEGEIDVEPIDKVWVDSDSPYIESATSASNGGGKIVNWDLAKALKACVEYIVASVFEGRNQKQRWMPSVLILARTGHAYGKTLTSFGECLERVLRKHPELQSLANNFIVTGGRHKTVSDGTVLIEVMTAHKAKGKEADTVIILGALIGQFPKVHTDNQLFGPFGVTPEDVLAEERRLFYVAVTRAQHRLMLLTETRRESPFIEVVVRPCPVSSPCAGQSEPLGIDAQSIKKHLDEMDGESLIRQNVSQEAISAWDQLNVSPIGLPEIGYRLSNGLHAELAWPEHSPPIAILSGRHRGQAARWRQQGWRVL